MSQAGPARVGAIDHVAFAARDLAVTMQFYREVLGLSPVGDPFRVNGAVAVQRVGAGSVLLSIHQSGSGATPVAANPAPGGLDICFEWIGDIDSAVAHLAANGIALVEGPVARRMNDGSPSQSVYFRDPDGNLLELMARG